MATPSFSPAPLIALFHGVRRYGLQLQSVSSTFDVDYNTEAGKQYIAGVGMQAGGMVALGALVLLAYGFGYALSCCCASRAKARPGRACTYIVLAFAALAPFAAGAYYVSRYSSGASSTSAAVQGFATTLADASTAVNGPLVGALQSATAASASLVTLLPPVLQPGAAALASQLSSALSSTVSLGSSLASASQAVSKALGLPPSPGAAAPTGVDAWLNFNALRIGLVVASWVLLGCSAGWLLLHAISLKGSRCCACTFRATACLTLLVGALIPVLAGVLYAAAMVGSDVCIAPGPAVSSVFNQTNSGNSLAAQTFYYTAACGAGGESVPVQGATASADDARATLASSSASLVALNASLFPQLNGAQRALVATLFADLVTANASLAPVVDSVQCAPLNAQWVTLLTAVCNEFVVGVGNTFFSLAAASAVLLVVLGFSVSLCWHHPGDGDGDDEHTAILPGATGGTRGRRGGASYGSGDPSDWGAPPAPSAPSMGDPVDLGGYGNPKSRGNRASYAGY